MLTKNDLKAINSLIRTAINELAVTKDDAKHFATKHDLDTKLDPIKKDTSVLKTDMKIVKQTTNKIRKDLEMAVGELDKDRDKLEKRVTTV